MPRAREGARASHGVAVVPAARLITASALRQKKQFCATQGAMGKMPILNVLTMIEKIY